MEDQRHKKYSQRNPEFWTSWKMWSAQCFEKPSQAYCWTWTLGLAKDCAEDCQQASIMHRGKQRGLD
ncbi:hypothetical protein AV530_013294 [Patagioenas fasciata monilis]|uniref:Uncharacterized protein n=1 Tax=Patagioenas fasciata monilis TaxID=372326 RepID=A0A1V4JNT8_PATFA|nr:hypothetical protein AV530_013294 [Patagioenas fasciata monilis]